MAMLHRFDLKRNNRRRLRSQRSDGRGDPDLQYQGRGSHRRQVGEVARHQGGTVRMHKQDGKFAEDLSRSRDPRRSPG